MDPTKNNFSGIMDQDPVSVVPAIKRMKELKEDSEAHNYLAGIILDFAQRSPANAKFIMDQLGDSDPQFLHQRMFAPATKEHVKDDVRKYLG